MPQLLLGEGCEVRYHQPDRDYRRAKGHSQSELKEVLRSPAHWLARYGPNAEPTFPSAAMIIGTALHAKVLEPEAFDGMFFDRSEKPKELTVPELKAALEEEQIEIPKGAKKADLESLLYPDGKPVDKRTSLSKEDFAIVNGMTEALRTHDVTGRWFDPGRNNYRKANEISFYVDEANSPYGMPIKGRVDRLEKTKDGWLILDLKTTDDASPDAFMKKAFNLGYHLQAAFYTDLVARTFRDANVKFIFCAIERRRPHGVALYEASPEFLNFGMEKVQEAASSLRYALETQHFGGYSQQIQSLGLPAWAKSKQNEPDLF